jgi:hypothetical protein
LGSPCPATAHADAVKCQKSILKESGKFAQAEMKALAKCEEGRLKGKIVTTCALDAKTTTALSKADTKIRAAIEKSCGGADKICSTTGDNDSLASIGWPGACPDFEGMGCTNAITDCGDISDCLVCVNDKATVATGDDLYYGTNASFGTREQVSDRDRQIDGSFLLAEDEASTSAGTRVSAASTPTSVELGDGKAVVDSEGRDQEDRQHQQGVHRRAHPGLLGRLLEHLPERHDSWRVGVRCADHHREPHRVRRLRDRVQGRLRSAARDSGFQSYPSDVLRSP